MGARAVRADRQLPPARKERGCAPEPTLPFTERIHGVLAFEAYNVFNSQPITGINALAFTRP